VPRTVYVGALPAIAYRKGDIFVRKVLVDAKGDLLSVWNPAPAFSANLAALLPAAASGLGRRRYGACKSGGALQYVVARNDYVP
jgi:hypothetical protein